jgi:hypothetical protein
MSTIAYQNEHICSQLERRGGRAVHAEQAFDRGQEMKACYSYGWPRWLAVLKN